MPVQFLYDDYLDDAFREMLLKLKTEVARERPTPVETIAAWTGVKPSTIYKWMEGDLRPNDWRLVVRLCINSSAEGFTTAVAWLIAGPLRIAAVGESDIDGNLNKEFRRNAIIWGQLLPADDANDGDRMIELGHELHKVADNVIGEGERKRIGFSCIRMTS